MLTRFGKQVISHRTVHRQEGSVAWPIDSRRPQNRKGHLAVFADFTLSRQLAFSVVRNGSRGAVFTRGISLRCWAVDGQARYMNETSDGRMPVNGLDQVACPTLVDLVILGIAAGLRAARAMNDVSNARQGIG